MIRDFLSEAASTIDISWDEANFVHASYEHAQPRRLKCSTLPGIQGTPKLDKIDASPIHVLPRHVGRETSEFYPYSPET